jgi:CarD family transcriptional regulator
MQFEIGDKIMHPKFGAGRITGEEQRELVDGFKHYYVIDVLGSGATAYVPKRKMDELGVRPVMSPTKLGEVIEILGGEANELSSDYKERQALVEEKLGTRRPVSVAEAVRDLTWHRKRKRLTQKDETLLNRGRELLAGEMALVTDIQVYDVQETIDSVLTVALARESDQEEDMQAAEAAPKVALKTVVQELLSRAAPDSGISARA